MRLNVYRSGPEIVVSGEEYVVKGPGSPCWYNSEYFTIYKVKELTRSIYQDLWKIDPEFVVLEKIPEKNGWHISRCGDNVS